MNDAIFEHIIKRLMSNADDALEDDKQYNDEFSKGKRIAYYEVLDTIRNDLIIAGCDLQKYDLNIDLDKKYI